MQNYSPNISREELEAFRQELLSSCHCAMPGIVDSFDPATQTVTVRPAFRSHHSSGGSSTIISPPLLRDVPVFFPGSREAAITWPISPGDECLVIFSDICIDGWFGTGSDPLPPSVRRHDLSDAFAFVGFRSRPNALPSLPTSPSFFGGSFVTARELAEALLTKSDTTHIHDDRYYTESETDILLSGKSDTTHTHDSRYYTESETDALLSGKSDTDHTHDDRYYTESETDSLLSGKKNTQTAVSDPSASGTSATFIATISQNAQGVITPAKKTVRTATASQSGLMSSTDKITLDAIPSTYIKAGSATGSTRTLSLNGTNFYPRAGQYASVAASASLETATLPNGALIFIAATNGTSAIYMKISASGLRRLTTAITNVTVACASSKVTITNGTTATIYTAIFV